MLASVYLRFEFVTILGFGQPERRSYQIMAVCMWQLQTETDCQMYIVDCFAHGAIG